MRPLRVGLRASHLTLRPQLVRQSLQQLSRSERRPMTPTRPLSSRFFYSLVSARPPWRRLDVSGSAAAYLGPTAGLGPSTVLSRHAFHASNPRLGVGGKIQELSKKYGYVARGVYLGLSVVDFPFCFLLVRAVGTEKIGGLSRIPFPDLRREKLTRRKQALQSTGLPQRSDP